MASDDYYRRMDEASRQPAADMRRAAYQRQLHNAARDRQAFHERLRAAARDRQEYYPREDDESAREERREKAERYERQRARSLNDLIWQEVIGAPTASSTTAEGQRAARRQSAALKVAGFALAALGILAAARLQQRRPAR